MLENIVDFLYFLLDILFCLFFYDFGEVLEAGSLGDVVGALANVVEKFEQTLFCSFMHILAKLVEPCYVVDSPTDGSH